MNRVMALLAIIAFAVMNTASVRAARAPMIGMASMSVMAMTDHASTAPHDQQPPCDQGQNMTCAACCAVVPVVAPVVPGRLISMTGFKSVDLLTQTGLVLPPALPPPRG